MTVLEAWTKLCESGEVTPKIEEELSSSVARPRVVSRRLILLSMGGVYELAWLDQNYSSGTLHVASVGMIGLNGADSVQQALDPWNALTSRLDQQRQRSCDMEAARILAKQP